jgi:acyl-CoA hydrolase
MEVVTCTTNRLVKSEDLNHHGTLYAGRQAEWFVEAGFVAAASLVPPRNIVCLKIHGMDFTRPVHPGEIITYESKIVYTGRTSLIAYIRMHVKEQDVVRGFITFVNVDADAKPFAHGVVIEACTPEDVALHEEARQLIHQYHHEH